MQCRLCQKDGELCLSHVVPEFFYKPIYDQKHRLFPRIGARLLDSAPLQKGLREPLLCQDCEQRLSVHEKYVSENPFAAVEARALSHNDVVELRDLTYCSVRLCFLSILWRMSVATGEAWKAVRLGPHEDSLRQMLLKGDPGQPWEFGFVCFLPLIEGRLHVDLIDGPDWIRAHRGRLYRMVLGGRLFLFFVGSAPFPNELRHMLITVQGQWRLRAVDWARVPFLMEDARRLVGAVRSGGS